MRCLHGLYVNPTFAPRVECAEDLETPGRCVRVGGTSALVFTLLLGAMQYKQALESVNRNVKRQIHK